MMLDELKPVAFEVKKIEKANKQGCVAAHVKFNGSEKTCTYVRKCHRSNVLSKSLSIVIDGCEVSFRDFDPGCDTASVTSIYRIYNTKGTKKLSTENQGSKKSNDAAREIDKQSTFNEVGCDNPVKHSKCETIKACMTCGIPVCLAGPAGSGKNFTVEQTANELGWDFYFSNSVQQEYKLTGFIDAGGDFHETEFYKACTSDNDSVFFLDEMDASMPEVLVLLNAAIANGRFEFPNGRVNLDKVHFVAAGNTVGSGSDEMCTGRMVIDQATLDRFAIIEFGYDTNIEMLMAENDDDLVDFMHSLRKSSESQGIRATFSYRCITMAKKLENAGMPLVEVIKIAVVKGLDSDTVNTLFVKTVNADNRFAKAFNKVKTA